MQKRLWVMSVHRLIGIRVLPCSNNGPAPTPSTPKYHSPVTGMKTGPDRFISPWVSWPCHIALEVSQHFLSFSAPIALQSSDPLRGMFKGRCPCTHWWPQITTQLGMWFSGQKPPTAAPDSTRPPVPCDRSDSVIGFVLRASLLS